MVVRERPAGWRVFFAVRGSVVPKIWPQIAGAALLGVLVTGLRQAGLWTPAPIPLLALSSVGAALSIFAAFRNSACYDRWWEARKALGQFAVECRATARIAVHHMGGVAGDQAHTALARACAALALLVRDLLRGEASSARALAYLAPADRSKVAGSRNPPARLLDLMGRDVAAALATQRLLPAMAEALEVRLAGLASALAALERLRSTPMPFIYTLLVQRTAYLYCLLLPLGLAPTAGWWTPVLTALVAYAFFGLDATGDALGAPFGTHEHGVPLDGIAATIELGILELLEADIATEAVPDPRGVVMH